MKKKLFLAATQVNVGKTTSSLGIYSALKRQFPVVGYMKPVGQMYLTVNGVKADKDSVLMQHHFHLEDALPDMSPITLPSGYTQKYIEKPDPSAIERQILEAFERLARGKDFMLIEGTGHAGVGSVVDFSNAAVARLLDVKVLIIAGGGIGQPIDEIILNKALFNEKGVEVVGAILNKVRTDKLDKIKNVAGAGLERLGIPLLGCIPHDDELTYPCMSQILTGLEGKLISGEHSLENVIEKMVIGALPPHDILDYFTGRTLLITPGNRDEIILAAISSATSPDTASHEGSIGGIVLTCGMIPHGNIMKLLKKTGLPVVLVEDDTFTAATKTGKLIVKTRPNDQNKINRVIELYNEHVNIEKLLDLIT
ncbi:MAG: AAA family ATPase [Chitinivibrionales bacterium]|nr:AAA family ATPase [Chitinivibrionales bacterium]